MWLKSLIALVVLVSVSCSNTLPSQVHIAYAGGDAKGNPNGMAVSYHTVDKATLTNVKFGIKSGVYTNVANGSQSSYYETFHHHTILSSLTPSTTYFYVVGSDTDGWSQEFSFKSAPIGENLRGNYSFAYFADLGTYNGQYSNAYMEKIKSTVDFVVHGGDVGYADDSFLHPKCVLDFCYEESFNTYMEGIESWASMLPYMVAPGNHEAECHDPSCLTNRQRRIKLSNFSAYNGRFRMPSPESGGALNMHYSFNYGNVHFISIDTETGYPGAAEEKRYVLPCGGFAEQISWLEADLKKANENRAERPWIFVQGHHPMYQGTSINEDFAKAMEDLFYTYGVDIYFSGHQHFYERELPVYKGEAEESYNNPRATTHIIVGGSGCDEMHGVNEFIPDPTNSHEKVHVEGDSKWRASTTSGPWTVISDKDDNVGISKVTIVDDSNLNFQYIRTKTGEVFDSFSLYRDHSQFMK